MSNSKYWGGKGEPEVGQIARASNLRNFAVSESFKQFIGLNVEIINKFHYEDDLVVVIHNFKCGHKSISNWNEHLAPIKSERVIAIEDLIRLMDSEGGFLQIANNIYDAGYRKGEVK